MKIKERPESIRLRSVKPADVFYLEKVFLANVPEFFIKEEWHDFLNYLNSYGESYFVLLKDQELIGGGGYYLSHPLTLRLSWDFIHPAFHKKGLGSALIRHCLSLAESLPAIEQAEVWTSQKAEGFYTKFGFQAAVRKKNYWGPNLHLIRMEKLL